MKLVDALAFTTEEIAIVRYPVVSYNVKGDQVKLLEPATMGQVTYPPTHRIPYDTGRNLLISLALVHSEKRQGRGNHRPVGIRG